MISEFLFLSLIDWLQSRLSLRVYMFWLIVISALAGIVLHAFIERCIEVVERGLKE